MKKHDILPLIVTALLFFFLAVTGNVSLPRINAASLSPLFCAAGTVLIACDMKTLFLNSERSSRNDDIPELTDEEFRAHHILFGDMILEWTIPQIIPMFWLTAAGKIAVSLALFFVSLIVTGTYCKYKFRPILENRRSAAKKELELQRKRETGWR